MKKISIVFIGGLTNGKVIYDYLRKNKYVDLKLTLTYPDDDLHKPRFIIFPNEKSIIKTHQANDHIDKIKALNPDFIFVAGWSELLNKEIISLPKKGVVGFHPSKLPYDRGRSVLAWQIEEGYEHTALTMFYYNEFPDGGDIIASENILIEQNDYINDILNKVDKASYNLMHAYFPLLRKGIAPRTEQNISEGNLRRLRTEKDSWINWNQNTERIYNKIRAISKPYPGAIGIINEKKYTIWKSESTDFSWGHNEKPGTLIAKLYNGELIIKTKDSFIKISEYEPKE